MKQILTGTRLRLIAELGIAGLLMIWMQRSAERQVNDLAMLEGELRKQEHSQEIRELRQQLTQALAAMPGLRIPDSAGQRPSELNSAKERDGWLRETWPALSALHEYAVSEHEYAGDVWRCMKDSGDKHAWHADRVAMHESPITMTMYGAARTFAIDTRVDASGKMTMQAHLKIAAHGGQHVPRVFFHDDTTGETGLVHIGFIGPHHLVPVASSS